MTHGSEKRSKEKAVNSSFWRCLRRSLPLHRALFGFHWQNYLWATLCCHVVTLGDLATTWYCVTLSCSNHDYIGQREKADWSILVAHGHGQTLRYPSPSKRLSDATSAFARHLIFAKVCKVGSHTQYVHYRQLWPMKSIFDHSSISWPYNIT